MACSRMATLLLTLPPPHCMPQSCRAPCHGSGQDLQSSQYLLLHHTLPLNLSVVFSLPFAVTIANKMSSFPPHCMPQSCRASGLGQGRESQSNGRLILHQHPSAHLALRPACRSHAEHLAMGQDKIYKAVDASLTDAKAQPLFDKAAEHFRDAACTSYVQWGNVHIIRVSPVGLVWMWVFEIRIWGTCACMPCPWGPLHLLRAVGQHPHHQGAPCNVVPEAGM